jgi:hypothetical protein
MQMHHGESHGNAREPESSSDGPNRETNITIQGCQAWTKLRRHFFYMEALGLTRG